MIDYDQVFQHIFTATRQAGIVAKMLQTNVINVGKNTQPMDYDTDYIKALRNAKSLADDIVQEILLNSLVDIPDITNVITLDTEERTQTAKRFTSNCTTQTLVIDPIDGTYAYCMKKANYSICSALISAGQVVFSIVYFPAKDRVYYYTPYSNARRLDNVVLKCQQDSICLDHELLQSPPNIIYKNNRVPSKIVNRLESMGYIVIDDTVNELGCTNALIECIEGRALSYIAHTKNIRDILLGAIISKMQYGQALDWNGDVLNWEPGGRLPRAIFTRYPITKEFLNCFTED